jgi:hypothetical protein
MKCLETLWPYCPISCSFRCDSRCAVAAVTITLVDATVNCSTQLPWVTWASKNTPAWPGVAKMMEWYIGGRKDDEGERMGVEISI